MEWNDSQSVIRQQLGPQEQLLWSGKPRGGIRLRASDALMIPFSLLWGGFAIFWETMVLHSGQKSTHSGRPVSIFMALWGIPFVLVGLYMIVGRFFVDARMRGKTFYGVTNQRVLIVSGLFSPTTKSLNLRTLSDMTLTEKADGSGTIVFGSMLPNMKGMAGMPWPGANRYMPPCLEMIENARQVHDTIRKGQQ